MIILLFFVLGLVLGYVLLPFLKDLAERARFKRLNYRGDPIPMGMGLLFFIVPALSFAITYLLVDARKFQIFVVVFLLVSATMCLLGLIDDVFGSRAASGIKGHFRCLFKGELTTGALKALGGLVIAFLAAVSTAPLREVFLNTLIIALAANTLNLLDLRPGRAGKGFLLGAGLLAAAAWGNNLLIFLAVVTGTLLVYLPADLRAQAMMGDAGSNVLGATLGLTAVWVLDVPTRVVVLLALVVFHLFTEHYSLTEVIAKNRVLHFIDRIGRRREEFDDR
ncbi:UDP-N-acetylmuramyl pentapeptide phosphotransferase [Desulforudis sp. DRI-14]|uniref:UDP-N-acetylmuramyl pentapeptide phosphotransferase n=1 Tax=Desulforudis sp. DRI-14 TaxID=3459793 RepID=UPI0040412BB1